jgi:hypothetical protein
MEAATTHLDDNLLRTPLSSAATDVSWKIQVQLKTFRGLKG